MTMIEFEAEGTKSSTREGLRSGAKDWEFVGAQSLRQSTSWEDSSAPAVPNLIR